jgi:hypothetical protein
MANFPNAGNVLRRFYRVMLQTVAHSKKIVDKFLINYNPAQFE